GKIMGSLASKFEEEGMARGMAQGMAKGMAQGINQSKKEIALYMKNKGLDINLISEVTSLSIEEINNLKKEKLKNKCQTLPY
ncbi:MAG: hypothetical protein ACR2HS_03905, partial [Gammaproteobacteria bacterium]